MSGVSAKNKPRRRRGGRRVCPCVCMGIECGVLCAWYMSTYIYSYTHTERRMKAASSSFDTSRKEERICVALMSCDEGQSLLRCLLSVQIRSSAESKTGALRRDV